MRPVLEWKINVFKRDPPKRGIILTKYILNIANIYEIPRKRGNNTLNNKGGGTKNKTYLHIFSKNNSKLNYFNSNVLYKRQEVSFYLTKISFCTLLNFILGTINHDFNFILNIRLGYDLLFSITILLIVASDFLYKLYKAVQ